MKEQESPKRRQNLTEEQLREQIRQELKEREERHLQAMKLESEENRRREEARLRAKILEEEEEKFYTSRGYVRYTNRYGQNEWLTPEEVEVRAKGRRKEFLGIFGRRGNMGHTKAGISKLIIYAALAVMTVVAVGLILYSFGVAKAQPQLGAVKVESTPAGAKVWMDGFDTNQSTPCEIGKLPGGTHTIVVSRPGYVSDPPVQPIYIRPGPRTTLSFELTGCTGLGKVNVAALSQNGSDETVKLDADAFQLYVDGFLLALPEDGMLDLPVGYHVLTPVKKGFAAEPRFQRVLIQAEKPLKTSFTFKMSELTGKLKLPESPIAGYLYLNGQFMGVRGSGAVLPVAVGTCQVEMPGLDTMPSPLAVSLTATANTATDIPFTFNRSLILTASAAVRTPQPGANIVIDGNWLPYITPIAKLDLPPGQHYLNLYRDGVWLASEDVPFLAEAGKIITLDHDF